MTISWREVEQAQDEKRCELVISGPSFSGRIEKNGLDPGIFKVAHLNFLEISKTHLKALPPDIGLLTNLTRVVISHNDLITLPSEIKSLKKLKFLDVSYNALSELPAELSGLIELQSLNVSFNQLSAIPPLNDLLRFVVLNICHNKFSALPVGVFDSKLIHFTEIIANNNSISEIPIEIENLGSLRVLDLSDNELIDVPGELACCPRLKELNLKGNKLKDKRLLKLVDQCRTKQVMDYIRAHCPKANAVDNKQGKSKKKTKQAKKTDVEEVMFVSCVTLIPMNRHFCIITTILPTSYERKHVVANSVCMTLAKSGLPTWRVILNIGIVAIVIEQLDELTILHVNDEILHAVITPKVVDIRPFIVCCKVSNVNLSDPNTLKRFITAQTKLHDSICEKRTVATIATHDLSKIQGNLTYDARPPKDILISSETKEILLEVTGNNLSTCKKVMDALLVEMLKLGLGNLDNQSTNGEEGDSQRNQLTVQQVKIVDEEGQLKVVYPSRTDIQTDALITLILLTYGQN
ncbi:UNVERIFIED_CONTAM: Lrrc47 [Trichonephila clavipes]